MVNDAWASFWNTPWRKKIVELVELSPIVTTPEDEIVRPPWNTTVLPPATVNVFLIVIPLLQLIHQLPWGRLMGWSSGFCVQLSSVWPVRWMWECSIVSRL